MINAIQNGITSLHDEIEEVFFTKRKG